MNGHPISLELERQLYQGFVEVKKGRINHNLSFRVEDGKVVINAGRLRYREDSEGVISDDGHQLLVYPGLIYKPLGRLVRGLIPPLGSWDGVATAAEFEEGDEHWRWKEGKPVALDVALGSYRFGLFSYFIPQLKRELRFQPDQNPRIPFGELEVTYGNIFSPRDLPIIQVNSIEAELDKAFCAS